MQRKRTDLIMYEIVSSTLSLMSACVRPFLKVCSSTNDGRRLHPSTFSVLRSRACSVHQTSGTHACAPSAANHKESRVAKCCPSQDSCPGRRSNATATHPFHGVQIAEVVFRSCRFLWFLIFALQIFARHFQNLLSLGPAAQQQKRKDSSLAHEQRHGRVAGCWRG